MPVAARECNPLNACVIARLSPADRPPRVPVAEFLRNGISAEDLVA
jgi:hypothetical protein